MFQNIAAAPDAEQRLSLHIAQGQPLHTSQLSELLSSLARDCRQVNRGRNLAIASIGSDTFIALEDAESAKGRKALLDFARALKDLIHKTKNPDIDLRRSRRQGPYRSVETMLRLAAETGSDLTIRHTNARGPMLEVRTPSEARDIRRRSRQAEFEAGFGGEAMARRIASPRTDSRQTRAWSDQIEQLALPGSLEPAPSSAPSSQLLCNSRNAYLVEMLAQELEGRDFERLAAAVRAEGSAAPGGHIVIRR